MDKDMEEPGYVLFCGVEWKEREERWVTQFGLTKLSITTTTTLRRWCALPLSNGLRASPPPIVHRVTTHGGMGDAQHHQMSLHGRVGSDWQLSVNVNLYA